MAKNTQSTTDITELQEKAAQAKAELEAAQDAAAELESRKRAAAEEADMQARRELIENYRDTDKGLLDKENADRAVFEQAVWDGNMFDALNLWMEYAAGREHRRMLRSDYNSACYRLGKPETSELRHYDRNPFEDMRKVVDRRISAIGAERHQVYVDSVESKVQAARDAVS